MFAALAVKMGSSSTSMNPLSFIKSEVFVGIPTVLSSSVSIHTSLSGFVGWSGPMNTPLSPVSPFSPRSPCIPCSP